MLLRRFCWARIQATANAGKFSLNAVQPGRLVRLEFRDDLKPGDRLATEIELPTNRLVGMQVSSYLDSPADTVVLTVNMSLLPDGIIYSAQSVVNAPAKDLRVTILNTDHRRLAR
jgi:hypothetical protein